MNDTVIQTNDSTASGRGMPLSMIVLSVISVASLAMACWSCRETRILQAELGRRPPLAVIQRTNLLRQASVSDAPDAVVHEGMVIKAAEKKLRDQGYIVLDGDHVLSWPRQFEVQPRSADGGNGSDDGEVP